MEMRILKFYWVLIGCLVLFAFSAAGADPETVDPAALNKQLLSGIHACFAGDYDRAWDIFNQVHQMDPNHPSREYYQALVFFWKNNIDHNNPRYDIKIQAYLHRSLEKAQNRLEKNENDIEALHYAGLSCTYLGRMAAHRGNFYEGGLQGEAGRKYLEKAILLCSQTPEKGSALNPKNSCDVCEDLYFPYGAYTYFAGKLPRLLRFMNFLWFLPKGSAEQGLELLARARDNACLHRLGTQSLLMNIYARFEPHRLPDALALSRELVQEFPDNPYLDLEHARILLKAGQYEAAYHHAINIYGKASAGVRNYDQVAELGAWLIAAESELGRQNLRQAEQILTKIKNNPAYQGNTLTARIFLVQGQIADLRKNRKQATAAYQKVLAAKDHLRDRETGKKAEKYLEKPFVLPES